MVIRFWRAVPPESALEAIDAILERAKEQNSFSVSMATKKDSFFFISNYKFRLFELLPVLRELDSAKAESLLRDNPDLEPTLKQFPEGMASADAFYQARTVDEYAKGEMLYMNVGGPPSVEGELGRVAANTVDSGTKDPKQAVERALGLPEWGADGMEGPSSRATALTDLARQIGTSNAELARMALTEAAKVLDQINARDGAVLVRQLIDVRLKLGDNDGADRLIRGGIKIAEKLYESDDNPDNRNQASKAQWPSAALWRHLVAFAQETSPRLVEQVIGEVRDPEIQAFQKVALAHILLDAPKLTLQVADVRKGGATFFADF